MYYVEKVVNGIVFFRTSSNDDCLLKKTPVDWTQLYQDELNTKCKEYELNLNNMRVEKNEANARAIELQKKVDDLLQINAKLKGINTDSKTLLDLNVLNNDILRQENVKLTEDLSEARTALEHVDKVSEEILKILYC